MFSNEEWLKSSSDKSLLGSLIFHIDLSRFHLLQLISQYLELRIERLNRILILIHLADQLSHGHVLLGSKFDHFSLSSCLTGAYHVDLLLHWSQLLSHLQGRFIKFLFKRLLEYRDFTLPVLRILISCTLLYNLEDISIVLEDFLLVNDPQVVLYHLHLFLVGWLHFHFRDLIKGISHDSNQ